MRKVSVALLAFAVLCGLRAGAQTFTTGPCSGDEGSSSGGSWLFGRQEHVCEVRRTTLPLTGGMVSVTGKNGAIEVVGEDRRDVVLEAKVTAQAPSRDEALALERQIRIKTDGTIEAEGPQEMSGPRHGWSVSYSLHVPRRLSARLYTENGSVKMAGIEGEITARTTNGGVSLRDLGGNVHATTVNGGVSVELDGRQWRGSGLVAKSTNGGVSVKAPEGYSAHLVASTVNGGVHVDGSEAQGRSHNAIDTNLGSGGATLDFETINGGVRIERN